MGATKVVKFESLTPPEKDVVEDALEFLRNMGIDSYIRIEVLRGEIKSIEIGREITTGQKNDILTRFGPALIEAASVTFELKGGALSVAVTSPSDVAEFQLVIKAPSTVTLDKATITGFMAGATPLSATSGGVTEYRWFKLAGSAGKTGTLSVPVTGPQGSPITLDKVNLLDLKGNSIPSKGAQELNL